MCRVTFQLVGINIIEGFHHRFIETHIIEISGIDDVKLTMGIRSPPAFTRGQIARFFLQTTQTRNGFLAVRIKIFVVGFSLTDTHVLHIGNEKFQLIVAFVLYKGEPFLGFLVIHLRHLDESQVVTSLGIPCAIVVGKAQRSLSQHLSRIKIAIVISIGKVIQPIHLLLVRRSTG